MTSVVIVTVPAQMLILLDIHTAFAFQGFHY